MPSNEKIPCVGCTLSFSGQNDLKTFAHYYNSSRHTSTNLVKISTSNVFDDTITPLDSDTGYVTTFDFSSEGEQMFYFWVEGTTYETQGATYDCYVNLTFDVHDTSTYLTEKAAAVLTVNLGKSATFPATH